MVGKNFIRAAHIHIHRSRGIHGVDESDAYAAHFKTEPRLARAFLLALNKRNLEIPVSGTLAYDFVSGFSGTP